ncbi:Uncharacterised protein [Vibrio cholerae]|uniref:Uncharacterized protein n=1 Tax=Vibrio cholerae TaxID=666 RepID=A0A655NUF0_VIBCL|nr:Uncharacterised protein [Vibrio cholerae]CSA30959.1 Uncharacterised protein [Vibrio cholerae]CSA36771.1 Uncharacterised protein [Vibrio cholerae]CSA70689.1 Uncharacterised protein [Vibrio cholerae]CSB10791.1 Uncharacterised protein [Vibrio cholerae]
MTKEVDGDKTKQQNRHQAGSVWIGEASLIPTTDHFKH